VPFSHAAQNLDVHLNLNLLRTWVCMASCRTDAVVFAVCRRSVNAIDRDNALIAVICFFRITLCVVGESRLSPECIAPNDCCIREFAPLGIAFTTCQRYRVA
jgi:hypothetical protein